MANFTLFVTQPPFDSQGAYSAYRFASAAHKAGHKVKGIFFYLAGALNANSFQAVMSDDLHMYKKWTELAKETQIPLMVCVTAANRRGICSQEDSQVEASDPFNLVAPFQEVGLGEYVELSQQSERVIQF